MIFHMLPPTKLQSKSETDVEGKDELHSIMKHT